MRISDWSSDVCSSDLMVQSLSRAVHRKIVGVQDRKTSARIQEGRIGVKSCVCKAAREQTIRGGASSLQGLGHRAENGSQPTGHGGGDSECVTQFGLVQAAQQANSSSGSESTQGGGTRSEEHTSELQSLMRTS